MPRTDAARVIYFDGGCPVCRREIGLYQRLEPLCPVQWVDVSQVSDCGPGLSQAQALRVFHVRRPNGQLLSGAAAFAEMWKCFAGWRWLGWLVSAPVILQVTEVAYRLFLKVRVLWR
jgi:predicted DCC family thiol-disulfide oxidoreductase YuxK